MHWNNQSGMTILLIHSLFVILKALIKQKSQEHQMAKAQNRIKQKEVVSRQPIFLLTLII